MSGRMHGFRDIDPSIIISGPLATMTLADQGAGVIMIEHPEDGDFSRQVTGRIGVSKQQSRPGAVSLSRYCVAL